MDTRVRTGRMSTTVKVLGVFLGSLLALPSLASTAAPAKTPAVGSAATTSAEWSLQSSSIVYHVHFAVKNVQGETSEAKGKGRCDGGRCEFLVAAPVRSFKSGDSNRDAHMWEVTKAANHPYATARYTFPLSGQPSEVKAAVEIDFAGEKNTYADVPLRLKWGDPQHVEAVSDVTLVLTKYKVDRPKLLGVAIDDEVPLHIQSQWTLGPR